MGFFDLFRFKDSENKNINSNNNIHIVDFKEHLFLNLDFVLEFKRAYSSVLPDSMFSVFISQESKKIDYSNSYYTYDGYIKIHIIVGNWWNGVLRNYPDILDTIETLFDHNGTEFTYIGIPTGKSICCPYPHNVINNKLQSYIDEYEKEHSEALFEREEWGAVMK